MKGLFCSLCRTKVSSPTSTTGGSRTDYGDPCSAQGDRDHSVCLEIEPKVVARNKFSSSMIMSSSESDSESELSDVQFQPRPTSQLFVRRLSQQKQRVPVINYNQLTESTGEGETNEEESDKEIDVEYVAPSCHRKPRVAVKRRNRPRVEQLQRSKCYSSEEADAVEEVKKVEQKKNISSLFQPQSQLLSENMKVCVASTPGPHLSLWARPR